MTSVSCPACPCNLASFEHLKGHYSAVHLDYFPYKCMHCHEWFSARYQLSEHALSEHQLSDIPIRCAYDGEKESELKRVLVEKQPPVAISSLSSTTTSPQISTTNCRHTPIEHQPINVRSALTIRNPPKPRTNVDIVGTHRPFSAEITSSTSQQRLDVCSPNNHSFSIQIEKSPASQSIDSEATSTSTPSRKRKGAMLGETEVMAMDEQVGRVETSGTRCPQCSYNAADVRSLNNHYMRHHSSPKGKSITVSSLRSATKKVVEPVLAPVGGIANQSMTETQNHISGMILKDFYQSVHGKNKLTDPPPVQHPCPREGCHFVTKYKCNLKPHIENHDNPKRQRQQWTPLSNETAVKTVGKSSVGQMFGSSFVMPPPPTLPNDKNRETSRSLLPKQINPTEVVSVKVGFGIPDSELNPQSSTEKKTGKFPCTESGCDRTFQHLCSLDRHLVKNHGRRKSRPTVSDKNISVDTATVASSNEIVLDETVSSSSATSAIVKTEDESDAITTTSADSYITETEDGMFVCGVCGYESTAKPNIKRHAGLKHKRSLTGNYACRICCIEVGALLTDLVEHRKIGCRSDMGASD